MPITITMPALSPTMEEGTLASWQVKPGDSVSAGDVLCEIETDKATMEVEAVEEGTIGKLLVEAGTEGVKVNAPIAVLLEDGEDESALDGFEPKGAGGGSAPSDTSADEPEPEASEEKQPEAEAASGGGSGSGSGDGSGGSKGGRIFASPLAKRMAGQEGLDLSLIDGSGPKGRIVKRDVEAALESGTGRKQADAPKAAAKADEPSGSAPSAPAAAKDHPPVTDDYEEIKLNSMRKTIARRLTESKQTVPHFYLTIDIELDSLLALRKDLNSRSDAYRISVNDFIVRASALALRKHPEINSQFTESAILQHRKIDVSVAVAIEGGLITPVVRNTDQKGLQQISAETKDLAGRAREGKLKPDEFAGGTFTISNLGMFGIDQFVAVINPPQAAILAVGSGTQKPVVKDGAVAVATVMTATLSADHRVFGGAEGAAFLETLKGLLEDPLTMLL